MFDPEGMPMLDLIQLAKDASEISLNKGFLKDSTEKWNHFEKMSPINPFSTEAYIDQITSFEVPERRHKLLEKVSGNEVDILRNTTFTSPKKQIEEYVDIISKLIKAGVFDDNQRQKDARESRAAAEAARAKGKKVL